MPSLYEEFCQLQPEVAEINWAYSLDDAFRMKLYWFPFRKKKHTQCLIGKIQTTYWDFLADGYMAWGINKKNDLSDAQGHSEKKASLFL